MSYHAVGDQVIITPDTLATIRAANRNRCRGISWVSDEFLAIAERCVGIAGEVTHVFTPGYDTTMRFGGQSLHMRHDFAVHLRSMQGDFAIVYPSVFKREELEPGGSLNGFFRVVCLTTPGNSTLHSEADCVEIIRLAMAGELKGSFGL